MITVTIAINERVIMARSAINLDQRDEQGRTLYAVDDGRQLAHHRSDGAVLLAMQMLEGIVDCCASPKVEGQGSQEG